MPHIGQPKQTLFLKGNKMANKSIFNSPKSSVSVPVADTRNEAGGKAYSMTDKHALAQYVCTGALNSTYYADARVQLDKILELTKNVPAKYIAQAAIYARKEGLMKDSPALLCAVLAVRDVNLLKVVFNQVIDNGKMLRNFVQIVRSGAVGRKSFGTAVKKLIQRWFDSRSDVQLFRDSIGNDPSLSDILKMSHPTPANKTREALYGYICGKTVITNKKNAETIKLPNGNIRTLTVMREELPQCVQDFETYKSLVLAGKDAGNPPDVPFQLLTALNLGKKEWTEIAKNAPWTMTRMNISTFNRHKVFEDKSMIDLVANRLKDPVEVKKSRCFPYQLLCAFKNVDAGTPHQIVNALQEAMETATQNVPEVDGEIYIMVDVSGSMRSPATGNRGTATSVVSCLDVAALMAASLLRKNKNATVIPFHNEVVHGLVLNPHDSVMTNATKLGNCPSGGTSCSVPIRYLNSKRATGDLIIMVSDNESWADMQPSGRKSYGYTHQDTGTSAHHEWAAFQKRNPQARFVAIDIQPNASMQVQEQKNVLNCGGFSDSIFTIVSSFVKGELTSNHWVGEIEKIDVSIPSPVVDTVKTGAQKALAKLKRDKNGRFK